MPASEFILKTTPPRLPRETHPRERLLRFWEQVRERTALCVVAPAGFGKTTLLLQWRRLWLEQGANVAWVACDARDEPTRFTLALLHALRGSSGRACFDVLAAQCARASGSQMETLTNLLAEVATLGTETVLVFDEAEQLPDATVGDSLQYLLLNAPANLRLVIGARVHLPLRTSTLVSRDAYAQLQVEDLRLRPDETFAILQRRLGERLSADDRAHVLETTEGWPLGVQLAVATIEHAPDPSAAVRRLSARHGHIQDYFAESLAARLSDFAAAFMVRIAILDHLDPDLCEEVTGETSAAALLDRLIQETPIMMVDERRDLIRFHPLARDFLLARFEALPRAEQAELHARASRWFAARGRFPEAARHALAADDQVLAQSFAARSLWTLGTEGRMAEAREWLNHVPARLLAHDASLRLVASWVHALGERNAEALQTARAVLEDSTTTAMQRMLALRVAGAAAVYADRAGLLLDMLALWPTSDDPITEPLLLVAPLNCRAVHDLHAGDLDDVRALAERVLSHGSEGSLRLAAAWAQSLAALVHLAQGNPRLAEQGMRSALTRAEQEEGRRSTVASVFAGVLAAALLERNALDEARSVLANRLDVIEATAPPDVILLAYRTLARIAFAEGDERRALDVLSNLDALARRRHLPRLRLHALAEQVRIHGAAHRLETVAELLGQLDRLGRDFEDEGFVIFKPHYAFVVAIAKTHGALAARDLDEAAACLVEAEKVLRPGHQRDKLTVQVLRAVVARERGDASALPLLAEALGLAGVGGCDGVLTDAHPSAASMANEVRSASPATGDSRAESRVKDEILLRAAPSRRGLLTAKEAEVLGLLEKGMSNKLIARTLDISSETVKWHVKNLFLKLSAGTRQHAVDRARLLGLVGG